MRRSTVSALVIVALLVGAAASISRAASPRSAERADVSIRLGGIREHLAAFQRIADRNGGNRLAGTPGYDESARYVATRMRAAGYRVRLQEFAFPFVADRTPPVLRPVAATGWAFRADRDYVTFAYSGSGRVEGEVVAVDLLLPSPSPNASTSGCEAADFAGFPEGAVALLQRGRCTFRVKVGNAIAAGAAAVVVFNEGNDGRRGLFSGTLGTPQVRVPALAASFAVGERIRNGVRAGPTGLSVRLETDMVAERRRAQNVVAESREGRAASTIMVGAHLDSVERGPGINDNGSGSAVILEIAEELAELRRRNRLRFVWWGAEELGLLGSIHYVESLSPAERRRIALYLNLDMVGSPNFATFVYDGDGSSARRGDRLPPRGSAAIERVFRRYFSSQKLAVRETGMGGGSDHVPFVRAGIQIGGLFTGAAGRKTAGQARSFGGRAEQPYDPCYHRACDTLANVNGTALLRSARAADHAIRALAHNAAIAATLR